MASLLGFEESPMEYEAGESLSNGRKLVPWLTWKEWLFVYQSLFSPSSDSIASALGRISTWRSRGCLPVVIEVTASIIEVQQKDPYFRKGKCLEASINGSKDHPNEASLSEDMLAMLHCMAIMRLVNGVVEKTRKKTEVSIAVAAAAIGLPRILIDVRHEGSHRELPALQVVRSASVKALNWLKSYYWEPQKKTIPFQGDKSATIRKEIKIKLRELTLGLKIKQSPQFDTTVAKGTRSSSLDWHCGRNKFLPQMAGKLLLSKTGGSKTKINKTLKIVMKLYSSFSVEFVSVLTEFLLKALNSLGSVELSDNQQDHESTQSLLNDWELVVTKVINAEPELLVVLLNTILEKIESQESVEDDTDLRLQSCHIEHLSSLFVWLVYKLKGIKHRQSRDSPTAIKDSLTETSIPKDVLTGLIRKCLELSASGNKKLMDSAVNLAQLMGDSSLMVKIKKLSSLISADIHATEEQHNSTLTVSEDNFIQMEESIGAAFKKLEMVKLQKNKRKKMKPMDEKAGKLDRWVVVRSWNPCPIGMLPLSLGSSGRLPDLDLIFREDAINRQTSRGVENGELKQCNGKREASNDIHLPSKSSVKRVKQASECYDSNAQDLKVSGGVLERMGEEELIALKSAVRILV